MKTAKDRVISLLESLPDDCSLEDIQYHLFLLQKVLGGLEAARQRAAIPQEYVEAYLSKWLIE